MISYRSWTEAYIYFTRDSFCYMWKCYEKNKSFWKNRWLY